MMPLWWQSVRSSVESVPPEHLLPLPIRILCYICPFHYFGTPLCYFDLMRNVFIYIECIHNIVSLCYVYISY